MNLPTRGGRLPAGRYGGHVLYGGTDGGRHIPPETGLLPLLP